MNDDIHNGSINDNTDHQQNCGSDDQIKENGNRSEEFRRKLQEISAYGYLSLAMALGLDLNLFEALDRVATAERPATAEEVAEIAGYKPRYCFEWLCSMATGGIIEADAAGRRFHIPAAHREALLGEEAFRDLCFTPMLPPFSGVYDKLTSVFPRDGPIGIGYSHYKDFHIRMGKMSLRMHKRHLITDFVPLIGMQEALERGIQVLDLGCGNGPHALELASHFPNSQFTGVDNDPNGIANAQKSVRDMNLTNLRFIQADAIHLDTEWTERFDLILIFNALHDQNRPDLALAEAHRCLKPEGLLAMVEVGGHGNCVEDVKKMGHWATALYAVSLFHCVPVGSTSDDSFQLGAMYGTKRCRELLNGAGFQKVERIDFEPYAFNCIYKIRK